MTRTILLLFALISGLFFPPLLFFLPILFYFLLVYFLRRLSLLSLYGLYTFSATLAPEARPSESLVFNSIPLFYSNTLSFLYVPII